MKKNKWRSVIKLNVLVKIDHSVQFFDQNLVRFRKSIFILIPSPF